MQSNLLNSLIKGTLTAARGATFDNTRPAYFVLYQGGMVGVYSESPKLAFHNYSEYFINEEGKVIQNTRAPKNFFLGASLNNFFDSIFENNYKISNVSQEVLSGLEGIDPRFIVEVKWYNPKGDPKLETLDLANYALNNETKTKLATAKTYFGVLNGRQQIKEEKLALIQKTAKFVNDVIVSNQKAGKNTWTKGGMLAIDIKTPLEENESVMTDYTSLVQKYANLGIASPITVNSIFNEALADSKWILGREVDLDITDYIYLYPRGPNMPKTQKAVPATDPSVALAN